MTPMKCSELNNTISSAYAEYLDTHEKVKLTTKSGSNCHFFDPFTTDNLKVWLRLDWGDPDPNGNPTLDADFYDLTTGKKRKLKGALHEAHHALATLERTYVWVFEEHCRAFKVVIHWLEKSEESLTMNDRVSGEICKGGVKPDA